MGTSVALASNEALLAGVVLGASRAQHGTSTEDLLLGRVFAGEGEAIFCVTVNCTWPMWPLLVPILGLS